IRGRLQMFVDRCFGGIERSRMWDGHVHLLGLGAGDTGCWLNPRMRNHLYAARRFQYELFREATGMSSESTADQDYVDRLLSVHRAANPDGKLVVMAFDSYVDETGEVLRDHAAFYTPNEYALTIADRYPEFVACASVHPYRVDALDRLDEVIDRGARAIKWLPNAMGMDPLSPRCEPFYRRLADAGIPLISHSGTEYAVEGAKNQELGNPLRLRRALDAGCKVVVAHAASTGTARDLDDGQESSKRRPTFDLFLRMMAQPQYDGVLYADLSAITVLNRSARILRTLLSAREWHHRFVNASDYPVPAIHIAINPRKLEFDGYLTAEDRDFCEKLARINPLLFDFCIKRAVRYEDPDGQVHRFANTAFETDHLFGA
ncbi:MAG: amidohydrolase, partial [Acidobacteriota bacterium]|nr:amidohydrolase [Acidobacteriota bacterium]